MRQLPDQCVSCGRQIAQSQGIRARAAINKMADGNEMYSCTFDMQGEKILTFYEYERPFRHLKREIKRWGIEDGTFNIWEERMAINGTRYLAVSPPTLGGSSARTSSPRRVSLREAENCPTTCAAYSGTRPAQTCISYNWRCIAKAAFSCTAAGGSCAAALADPTKALVAACIGTAGLCGLSLTTDCCQVVCGYCLQCGVV